MRRGGTPIWTTWPARGKSSPESPSPVGGRTMMERRRTLEALNTQYQILKSRGLAESVVTQLALQRHPELMAGPILTPWERFSRGVLGRVPAQEPGAGEVLPAVE